jgi:hypothetical protein
MTANVTSAQNTNSRDLDPVVLVSTGATKLKRAVAGSAVTASGLTPDSVAQEIGTDVNAATDAATRPIVVAGAVADETSPSSVTEGQRGYLRMTLAHNLHVVNVADAATLSNVASSATNVTLLAANANRIGATIFNDSTQVLYVKFGATASSTSYTVQVAASGYYEVPAPVYRGIIDGIWASANGNARLTELT